PFLILVWIDNPRNKIKLDPRGGSMLGNYDFRLEIGGNIWLKSKAHVLLPPCDRIPVTCSYTLSTCREHFVGFVQGRFGSLMNGRAPLAICWPGGITRYVRGL